MTTQLYLANAIAKAAAKNITTFSQLQRPSIIADNAKHNYLRKLTTPGHTNTTTTEADFRHVIIDDNNTLTIIHSLTNDSESDLLIGLASDSIAGKTTISVPSTALNKVTIALASDELAGKGKFETIETLPTDCKSTTNPTENLTPDDLEFPSTFPYGPVFAVIPTSFPLTPSETFTLEGTPITADIQPQPDHSDRLTAWIDIIKSTITKNDEPCNAGGKHFQPTDWTGEGILAKEVENYCSRLSTSFTTTVTPILPTAPEVRRVQELIDAKLRAKITPWLATQPTPAPDAPPNQDTTTNKLLEIIAQNMRTTGPQSADNTGPNRNMAHYALHFSRAEDGDLTPATIEPHFTRIMAIKDKSERHRQFIARVASHQTTLQLSDKVWAAAIDFDTNIINQPFVEQLATAQWYPHPLHRETGSIKRKLNLFNFLQADTNTQQWDAYCDITREEGDDDKYETDKAKRKTKARELYIGGRIKTPSDLKTALANFLFFISLIIENPEECSLFHHLTTIMDYHRSKGRSWLKDIASQYPEHGMYNILYDINSINSIFVKDLATNTNLLSEYMNENPIPATSSINLVNTTCMTLITNLTQSEHLSQDIHFVKPYKAFSLFPFGSKGGNQDGSKSNPNKKQKNNDNQKNTTNQKNNANSTDKKPNRKKTNPTPEQKEYLKSRGLLKYTGSEKAPFFNHTFDGATTACCKGWTYQGLFCSSNDKDCPKHHLRTPYHKLSQKDKEAVDKFIKLNKDVQLATSDTKSE